MSSALSQRGIRVVCPQTGGGPVGSTSAALPPPKSRLRNPMSRYLQALTVTAEVKLTPRPPRGPEVSERGVPGGPAMLCQRGPQRLLGRQALPAGVHRPVQAEPPQRGGYLRLHVRQDRAPAGALAMLHDRRQRD